MATTIRRAALPDADFLAWVMLSASRAHLSRGIWDLLIGRDEAGCLAYLRLLVAAQPTSLCHYESFWIADIDGHPASALSGFEFRGGGWSTAAEAMANVQRDLNWTEMDVAASQKRMAPVWACFLPDVGADWGIENVATRPEYRRRGLTSALLDQVLQEGIGRGCKLAQIVTFHGNDDAISVYERAGFSFSDDRHCPEMASVLKAPGFVRLTKKL